MRKIYLLLFFIFPALAQAQCLDKTGYERDLRQADAYTYTGRFKLAFNKYMTAKAKCRNKAHEIDQRLKRLFDKIETLKNQAVADEQKIQQTITRITSQRKLKEDAFLNIRRTGNQIISLINAYYFYKGKYGLAYNHDQFYFIDKAGEEVKQLGRWTHAEQFDKVYDLAKVTKDKQEMLLDTLGNNYQVAYQVKDLTRQTTALQIADLDSLGTLKIWEYPQLELLMIPLVPLYELPDKIGQLTHLKFLDLRSSRVQKISPEIGKLKQLQKLDISYSIIQHLPEAIGQLTNLRILNLASSNIKTLPKSITKLKNLRKLDLSFTKVTANAVKKLRKELPNCKIDH